VSAGGDRLFDYVRNSVSSAIRKACIANGIPRWHPHQLRHTRASEIRRGHGIETAAVVLGHSKPDTTLIYAEPDQARARELMREVG
jgi:integrase